MESGEPVVISQNVVDADRLREESSKSLCSSRQITGSFMDKVSESEDLTSSSDEKQ